MPRKLILDVDTGTDDAVAIMLAALHPEVDLVGVTTVNGNAPLDVVVDNTLRVIELTGREVPVYRGAASPSVRPDFPVPRALMQGRAVHARPLPLPAPRRSREAGPAADFLIETISASPGEIALVTTAPLTNLATALAREPRLVAGLRELVVLGGSHAIGNVTPAAEFNVWADPEAARAVLRSGIDPITLITLDTTHAAPLDRRTCADLRATGSRVAVAAATLIEQRIASYRDRTDMAQRDAAPIHDAFAVAAFVERALISTVDVHADVETRGELTIGRTVIDLHARSRHSPNVRYGSPAQPERFEAMLVEVLTAVPA